MSHTLLIIGRTYRLTFDVINKLRYYDYITLHYISPSFAHSCPGVTSLWNISSPVWTANISLRKMELLGFLEARFFAPVVLEWHACDVPKSGCRGE